MRGYSTKYQTESMQIHGDPAEIPIPYNTLPLGLDRVPEQEVVDQALWERSNWAVTPRSVPSPATTQRALTKLPGLHYFPSNNRIS